MRIKLQPLIGQTLTFWAQIESFSVKNTPFGRKSTILLTHLTQAGDSSRLSDHLWVVETAALKRMNLEIGQTIEFCARVSSYRKGAYRKLDYNLMSIDKIKLLSYQTTFLIQAS